MKKSFAQVEQAIIMYAKNEWLDKLQGLNKWLLLGATGIAVAKAEQIADAIMHSPLARAVVDDDGMIDVDMIYQQMIAAAETTGPVTQNIPMIGAVKFDRSDIEKLYTMIQNQ